MVIYFFFSSRRRHTRCSRDWSSDVCYSDLEPDGGHRDARQQNRPPPESVAELAPDARAQKLRKRERGPEHERDGVARPELEIGRASCRERVEMSVVAVSFRKRDRDDSGSS